MSDEPVQKYYEPSPQDVDAFMFAAINGNNTALIELLKKYGPNIVNKKDNSGGSGLMNVGDAEQGGGMTALMYAAWGGHKSTVGLLLEHGALPAVDAKDEADAVRILTSGAII